MSNAANKERIELEQNADPLLISDGNGVILWSSPSTMRLFNNIPELTGIGDIFSPQETIKILSCRNFTCFETDFRRHFDMTLKFAVIVLEIGPGDPAQTSFLITLQPFDLKSVANVDSDYNLSSIAHDLKNPLGAVFGYADALLDTELGDGLQPKQREVLQRIRKAAVRSIELVRNLQNLSSLRSEDIPLSSKEIDLNIVTQAVIQGTWRDESAAVEIKIELSPEPVLTTVGRILIDRVLTNLYGNALKFTPPRGKIKVKTYKLGESAVFEVNNNLPVINADELGKIFENRYRATSSSGIAGTGLGLYIASQIMHKVGGELKVDSNEEQGTTFWAFFPAANADPTALSG